MKKRLFLVAALSTCALACIATACDKTDDSTPAVSTPPESTPAEPVRYQFKALAAADVDFSELGTKVVVYNPDGSVAASLRLDNSGERTKTLTPAEYTVRLETANGDTVYETKTDLTCDTPVLLYYLETPAAGTGSDADLYQIDNGYYALTLTRNDPAFYAFTPKTAGTYRVLSVGSADVELNVHDGSEVWVNPVPAATIDDVSASDVNFAYEFQVTPTDIANMGDNAIYQVYFSVDFSSKATNFDTNTTILYADKISNDYDAPAQDDTPETIVLTKADDALYDNAGNVVPFTAQDGTLTELPYNAELVYNATDRYYHVGSENGPLVVMPFTVAPSRYLDMAFNTVGNPELNENALPSTLYLTFVDETTGKKTVKQYNTLINEIYPSAVNTDGVYPLTQEMYEFVCQYVAQNNSDKVSIIPTELRWKAPLYYYETGTPADDRPSLSGWSGDMPASGNGTQTSPYIVGNGNYCAPFGPTFGILYYQYTATENGYLTVKTEDESTVMAMLYEYEVSSGDNFTASTESADLAGAGAYTFQIHNGGTLVIRVCSSKWESAQLPFTLEYSVNKPIDENAGAGSADKPYVLELGETIAQANGTTYVYYTFTPAESGSYTIGTNNDDASIDVWKNKAWGTKVKGIAGATSATITLEAGTTYVIGISEGVSEVFTVAFYLLKK